MKGHTASVEQIAWDPKHDDRLATASTDKTVCIWDTRTAKPAQTIQTGRENISIAWSPDSTFIASGNKVSFPLPCPFFQFPNPLDGKRTIFYRSLTQEQTKLQQIHNSDLRWEPFFTLATNPVFFTRLKHIGQRYHLGSNWEIFVFDYWEWKYRSYGISRNAQEKNHSRPHRRLLLH